MPRCTRIQTVLSLSLPAILMRPATATVPKLGANVRESSAVFSGCRPFRFLKCYESSILSDPLKGVRMPYIEVKAVDRRFDDPAVSERLIAALTDAACQVFGEESRPQIWVVVDRKSTRLNS